MFLRGCSQLFFLCYTVIKAHQLLELLPFFFAYNTTTSFLVATRKALAKS